MHVLGVGAGTCFPIGIRGSTGVHSHSIPFYTRSVSAIVGGGKPGKSGDQKPKYSIGPERIDRDDTRSRVVKLNRYRLRSGAIAGEIFRYETHIIVRTGNESE